MGDDEARAAGLALLSKRTVLTFRLPAEFNDSFAFEGVEQLLVFVNPDLVGGTHRGLRFTRACGYASLPKRHQVVSRSAGRILLHDGSRHAFRRRDQGSGMLARLTKKRSA